MATNDEKPPVDKDKLAVALTYNTDESPVPVVSAKGRGHVAEAIIALAKEHGIEVREDSDLAMLLSKLDIDMPIPLEAYAAVAEILAYVYKVNDKARRKHEGGT
jgi:flagellar biosynthesis protein